MTAELAWAGVAELCEHIRGGRVSATELTQLYLDRIDELDVELGSYVLVDAEGALTRARAIDQALGRGQDPGPLAGIPIALKDILVTQGMETTAGSKILAGWIPPYDASCVSRLRRAGAIVLGKLNLDEFAMGSSTENSAIRPCKNPWDVERVPGGSSGGSAAAVAAGLCAASLGTDTGGSIRQPASFCGLVGLKPTYGRVSRHGVIAFASSLDQVGPITRSTKDAALLLELIAGLDARDATSLDAPVPRYRDAVGHSVRGLAIGLPEEYFAAGIDAEVAAAVEAAAARLERQGARLSEISLPHTRYAVATYYLIAPAEASSNLARYDGVRFGLRVAEPGTSLLDLYRQSRGTGFGREVKRRIMLGTFALRSGHYEAYYLKAQKLRALIKSDFDRAFATIDLVLSPTYPTAAFRLGERLADPLAMYAADSLSLGCNLAGLPGISVPCGFTAGGLPVGLQLIGRPLDESTLLAAAAAVERESGLAGKRPSLAPVAPKAHHA